MLNIGVTGAEGFIGRHLRFFYHCADDVSLHLANRNTFIDDSDLIDFVQGCDVIVHLAGMNRGDPEEIEDVNIKLAKQLIEAIKLSGRMPFLLFASSRQAHMDNPYGRSKREAARLFREWASSNGAEFAILDLPHIFGEYSAPFYNSAVATFCYQLANGDKLEIIKDAELELLHVQELAGKIDSIIRGRSAGDIILTGTPVMVTEVADRLTAMSSTYEQLLLPDISDCFSRDLFNTYRSFLFPHTYPFRLSQKSDSRGSLFEAVKCHSGGQCFLSTTKPQVTRGNHYHRHKFERFLVIKGEAIIRLRRIFDDTVHEFDVCGSKPVCIDMPTFYTHNITNIGSGDMITLFWANEIFNPEYSDTYPETV